MSNDATRLDRFVTGVEPQLFVSNLARALDFFTGKIGFVVVFAHGSPPFFGQVSLGRARLNLRLVTGPVFDPGSRARETDALSATIPVTAAEPLFEAFSRAGASFHQTLRTEKWDARTFIVADPDGNLIAFAGPATARTGIRFTEGA